MMVLYPAASPSCNCCILKQIQLYVFCIRKPKGIETYTPAVIVNMKVTGTFTASSDSMSVTVVKVREFSAENLNLPPVSCWKVDSDFFEHFIWIGTDSFVDSTLTAMLQRK